MAKKKILIIDDEEGFTRLIKLNLERTGRYEVKEENSSSAALASIKEFKPDLILLDILMPDKTGDEIAFEVNNDKSAKGIPIVFLTAVAKQVEVKDHDGVIGGYPFIAKPVTTEQLIEIIEKNIKVK